MVMDSLLKCDINLLPSLIRNRKVELEISCNDGNNELCNGKCGFISEDVFIKISDADQYGYYMLGIDYLDYVNYLRANLKEIDEVQIMVYTADYVREYFKFDIYGNVPDNRSRILEEKCTGDKKVGIDIFKGIGQGVCLEHSLLFQNLLAFMGLDVMMLCMVGVRNKKMIGHTANIINLIVDGNIKHIYYDLTSLEIYKDNERYVAAPVIKNITDEELDKFMNSDEELVIKVRDVREESGYRETYFLPKELISVFKLSKYME